MKEPEKPAEAEAAEGAEGAEGEAAAAADGEKPAVEGEKKRVMTKNLLIKKLLKQKNNQLIEI